MKIQRLLVLLVVLFPLAATAQMRTTDLTNPAPISIPNGVSPATAQDAVVEALHGRGWVVAEEDGNHIIADLHVRAHWAQIEIEVGNDAVMISYRDSDNLRYTERDDGRIVIHNSYHSWINYLVNDIRTGLSNAQRNSR